MYSQGLLYGDDSQPPRSTGSRVFKLVIAPIGICCLVLLGVMALSTSSPRSNITSTDDSTTNLLGLGTSMSTLRKPSPFARVPVMTANQLPGPSPLKELALAGIEAANRCDRDVSANARFRAIWENMDSATRAQTSRVITKATQAAVAKMSDLKAGQLAPTGFWDPLGISTNLDEGKILFYREAELKHGRVCMLASLGFLVGENFHPLFGGNIDVPSYIAFQETPLEKFWYIVIAVIAFVEGFPNFTPFNGPSGEGWVYKDAQSFSMNSGLGRVPGDFGFDPLGLKPEDPAAFLEMQNKELNNGRLAMIAMAGMVAQELVTGQKLFQ